jgi:hypothetical protein
MIPNITLNSVLIYGVIIPVVSKKPIIKRITAVKMFIKIAGLMVSFRECLFFNFLFFFLFLLFLELTTQLKIERNTYPASNRDTVLKSRSKLKIPDF